MLNCKCYPGDVLKSEHHSMSRIKTTAVRVTIMVFHIRFFLFVWFFFVFFRKKKIVWRRLLWVQKMVRMSNLTKPEGIRAKTRVRVAVSYEIFVVFFFYKTNHSVVCSGLLWLQKLVGMSNPTKMNELQQKIWSRKARFQTHFQAKICYQII